MDDNKLYIERREQGDYAVKRSDAERASAVRPTQEEAIERAKEMSHSQILVERVRDTSVGGRDQWRKP